MLLRFDVPVIPLGVDLGTKMVVTVAKVPTFDTTGSGGRHVLDASAKPR